MAVYRYGRSKLLIIYYYYYYLYAIALFFGRGRCCIIFNAFSRTRIFAHDDTVYRPRNIYTRSYDNGTAIFTKATSLDTISRIYNNILCYPQYMYRCVYVYNHGTCVQRFIFFFGFCANPPVGPPKSERYYEHTILYYTENTRPRAPKGIIKDGDKRGGV